MKLNESQKQQILTLDEAGFKSRKIAEVVLGREGRKSTVNDFLASHKAVEESYPDELSNAKPLPKTFSIKKARPNERVVLISDPHIPYHHPDALEFLAYLKGKYNPDRIIAMGDELGKHALSYHDSDPDLPSAGDELRKSLPVIAELKEMFPVMDVLESNHGSLVWRKAKTHGVPRHYLKSYNDVLGVDEQWQWHFDMTIRLPTGNLCYLHHGKSADVLKLSQQMGMCAAQGHYHEKFKVDYWGNPTGLYWGLQTGCLIDDTSYAFAYNNVNIKRPIIGTSVIVEGQPIMEPMILDTSGRWIGRKL